MPRSGVQYDVDDVWRDRVVERLAELGKKPAWLSQESGCPKSMVSELLSGQRHNTTYLPEIHKALRWPPPMGPLLSEDDEELMSLASRLTPDGRSRLKERALALAEENRTKKR